MADVPRYDSDLRAGPDVTADDVRQFLADRLADPAVVDGNLVFNFHSRDLDAAALLDSSADLDARPQSVFVVPYQASGLWGFMVDVLPPTVADAPLLVYRKNAGEYAVQPNPRNTPNAERSDGPQPLYQALREGLAKLDAVDLGTGVDDG